MDDELSNRRQEILQSRSLAMAVYLEQKSQKLLSIFDHSSATIAYTRPPDSSTNMHSIEKWWDNIRGGSGQYSCYGIFLVLPSDITTIDYLISYIDELHVISGKNCLILLVSLEFLGTYDTDAKDLWKLVVGQYSVRGHSVQLGRIFDTGVDKFPCLILFEDIRTDKYITISLTDMSLEDIVKTMRIIFTVVDTSIRQKKSPIIVLEKTRAIEKFNNKGKFLVSQMQALVGKTIETVLTAWIKAVAGLS